MTIYDFIDMLGGLALFLYGMQVLGDGLKSSASGKMERMLEKLTSNKWKAALLGAGVTAVIQSSGATVVMVVGLVNSGIMTLEQSVGVTIGANVGTTITAWLLSLTMISGDNIVISLAKPDNFAPILALIGVAMLMLARRDRTRHAATILVGFCVLMMGMSMMSGAFSGLADDPEFTGIMTAFAEKPFVGLLAGLVVTVVLQSSSASIGVLQSMSMSGSLTYGGMIPALMGANIGSAITGLIGAIGARRSAKRAAWLQMLYCLVKAVLFMIIFYALDAILHFGFMKDTVDPIRIAIFHTCFNVAALLALLPGSDILVRIVERFLPVLPEEKGEVHRITILDEHFFSTPSFALEQARTATNDMAQYAKEAMYLSTDLIFQYSEEKAAEVERLENTVDDYEDQLESYLVKLAKSTMTARDSHTLSILLHSISDFERITDHSLNICQAAGQLNAKELSFSSRAVEEMKVYTEAVRAIMNMTVLAFQNGDLSLARQVEPLEEVIDGLNMEEKKRHVRRLRKGKCTIEAGFILSDITTDYERISDHCSNIAVALLQVNEDGFDTHEYLERVETVESEEFKAMVRDFEAKYRFPGLKKDEEIQTVESVKAAKAASAKIPADKAKAQKNGKDASASGRALKKAGSEKKTAAGKKSDEAGNGKAGDASFGMTDKKAAADKKSDADKKTDAEKKAARKAKKAAREAAAMQAQRSQQAIADAALDSLARRDTDEK